MDWFLQEASKHFELILFTAAEKRYAELILSEIDPNGEYFSFKHFRDSCTIIKGLYFKDLARLRRNLGRILIVDDTPGVYGLLPANGIKINQWIGNDLEDNKLSYLLSLLQKIEQSPDVRFYLFEHNIQAAYEPDFRSY